MADSKPHKISSKDPSNRAALRSHEIWWRDQQIWLEARGYLLRPRYKPDWQPSWKNTTATNLWPFEDYYATLWPNVMDATRIADGKLVMLKKVVHPLHPHEVELSKYFATEPLASDPRNHCLQLNEILLVPGENDVSIMVLPFLAPFDFPPFRTVGEVVGYLTQVLEGLQFMHDHHVAHGDCMGPNIMMEIEPIFPQLYHPVTKVKSRDFKSTSKRRSRTMHPPRYFLIDFGLSRRYDPADGEPRDEIILGGDKTVPELQNDGDDELWNPFPIDIYYMGNMIRQSFLQEYRGLEFLNDLVADMVHDDPSKRPTMDAVVSRFDEIRRSLPRSKLRSYLFKVDEYGSIGFRVSHFVQTVVYMVAGRSAIPSPRRSRR